MPYSQCCKVLGVEVDLTKSPSGMLTVRNTEARQNELISCMRGILEKEFYLVQKEKDCAADCNLPLTTCLGDGSGIA